MRGCNPFRGLWATNYTASRPDLDYITLLANNYLRRYGEPPEVIYIPDSLMDSFERTYTELEPYPHIEYIFRGFSIGRGDCKRLYCQTPEGERFYL